MIFHKTYQQEGHTEWVVLVHGAGGSSSIWFKQIRELVHHFNVLMVDLRGHGKSKDHNKANSNYSFRAVGEDVVEVMNHLGISSAHFMGVSLGSVIVRSIAEVDVSKIKTMVLCGAVTRLNTQSRFLMKFASMVRKMIPFVWLYTLFAYILMPKRRNRESRNLFIRDAKTIRQSEFMRWFTLTAEVNPLLKYFTEKEIPVPTLYVMGDEDYMFLPQVKNLIKKHRSAVLRVFENCGHVCNVEHPTLFNQVSIEFVKQHS